MTFASRLLPPIIVLCISLGAFAQEQARVWTPTDGLPIVTAEGDHIGYIVQANMPRYPGHVAAEIARPLGFGIQTVILPLDLLSEKGDHVILKVSQPELRKRAIPVHDR